MLEGLLARIAQLWRFSLTRVASSSPGDGAERERSQSSRPPSSPPPPEHTASSTRLAQLLGPPRQDEQKLKLRLFVFLLAAFALGSLAHCLLLCIFSDRSWTNLPALMAMGSAIFYSFLLVFLYIGRHEVLHTIALLACSYYHLVLLMRCILYGQGMRSECFVWLQQLPILAFFMLGRRAGIWSTLLIIVEGLFLLIATEDAAESRFQMDCVVMRPEENLVLVPKNCSLQNFGHGLPWSHLGQTAAFEIWVNRTLALLFFSGLAYAYEEVRTLATSWMGQLLREKEITNVSLRKATKARTRFLSNMSHELRTPLHGIIAMTRELLTMPLTEKARESAKIVSDCADHLLGLVNDILDLASIETRKLELEAIPFSVVDQIKKVVNLHLPSAIERKIRLITNDMTLDNPCRIGDPSRLRQILSNLLSNAIKFTPEGGMVIVHVQDSGIGHEKLLVRVEDTGIGIPKEYMEHLFHSFSQQDTSVRRRYGGPGLGLALCKKLCEAMGGEISCESELGKGSTFTFTISLPVYSPSPRLTLPITSTRMEDQPKGARVLVVEDNAINQKVATKMLTSMGCSVKVAGDGAEGVDMFAKEPFDIILMDVQMPVMDGFQATARIRQIENERRNSLKQADDCPGTPAQRRLTSHTGTQSERAQQRFESEDDDSSENDCSDFEPEKERDEIPIVALTASATPDYEEKCMHEGMTCFLTKPLRRETLLATLSSLCGKNKAIRGRNHSV